MGIDYTGLLELSSFIHKYYLPVLKKIYPSSVKVGKMDLYYIGELDENVELSVKGSGDDLTTYRWVPIDEILNGDYKDEHAGVDWMGELIRAIK